MWTALSALLLLVEIGLLIGFVVGKFRRRRFNETGLFLGTVFVVNLSLYIVPFLYGVDENTNIVLGLLTCVGYTLRSFLFNANINAVTAFADAVPLFTYTYMLGAILALLATVSTAVEMFSNSVRNSFRLNRALRKGVCDIVVGNSPKALQYAKSCNGVLLLDDSVSKDSALELMEAGFVVLRRSFTDGLFRSRQFNATSRYNIICTDGEKALEYIETFIACKKLPDMRKNIKLYVELSANKADTVHREIIEKSGLEASVTTYCTDEMLARTFMEENPITRHLPADFIREGAIRADARLHTWFLGFGSLSRELYRQSVMHNQLVTFADGTYRVLPICYHLCDTIVDRDAWNIDGLPQALEEMTGEDCFPLPELPCETHVVQKKPYAWEVLTSIKRWAQGEHTHTRIIIDTGDDCRNIELGARLKAMLPEQASYHIFVRSEVSFTHDDGRVTYFGKSDRVFTHDVIVGDSLSLMARKLNEIYTARYAAEERGRPDFEAYIRQKALEDWEGMDRFTMYSNIFAAMNLRLKLNLLGLDYGPGKEQGQALVCQHYGHRGEYPYEAYFTPSVRNALIAQEHARWNAYHLVQGYLPMPKGEITEKSRDARKVRFTVKNPATRRHACLTTYQGLDALSAHLAQRAGGGRTAADYDYYIYDEMLITTADELLRSLGCAATER